MTKSCRICSNVFDARRIHCNTCGSYDVGKKSYIIKHHKVLSFVRAHGAVSQAHIYGTVIQFQLCDQENNA